MCFRGGWGSGGVTQWIWRRILNRPLEVFSGNLRGALRLFLYGRAGDKASQVWLFPYLLMRNDFWVQFPSKWRLFAGLSLCLTWSSPANLVLLDDTSGGYPMTHVVQATDFTCYLMKRRSFQECILRFYEVLREKYCRLQSCLFANFNSEKVFRT